MRLARLVSTLVLTALAASPLVAQAPAGNGTGNGKLAIVGGYLIDGNEGPPLQNAVVLVEGDRIVHVGTVADTPIPGDAKVIDANGYTVMPGLHDAHVHVMIVGHGVYDDYFPKYDKRFREVMPVSAKHLLMAGVTSARDLGAPLEDIIWLKKEIESGRLVGPRLFVSGPFLQKSLPRGSGTSYDSGTQASFRWTVNGAGDARAKTRQLIDAGVDLIKVIQIGDLTPDERRAIADEARKSRRHIAVHAGNTEEVRIAAEMGARTIEHVGGGRYPLYPEEQVQLMVENGIFASPTSVVGRIYDITTQSPERLDNQMLKADLPADFYEDMRNSLNFFSRLNYFAGAKDGNRNHAGKIKQLYDAGVRILVGTDSGTPMNFHHESTWHEMELFTEYGIHPMKVISMATRLPALAYGMGRELGTIEPGKLADIIVVDGNPLVTMSALRNVVHVVKGGVQYK
ncbi:MAG: amidohydrolase family protein [Chloroflexi bacterium]|nr:amidohydrolase family protein [Chloroflexota bacterium]